MAGDVRVLVVGLGIMGLSHALAYRKLDGFDLVGVCSRTLRSRADLPTSLATVPRYEDYETALDELRPDAVSINTWTDSHASFAIRALESGAHVFVEKPLAVSVEAAEQVVAAAVSAGRKLVVGYILRHHPSWAKFVELARGLGSPLVMRMNLNQQSTGAEWQGHRKLMESTSPIVDCGVHYVDIMCLVTGARPVRVYAIGARLSEEIAPDMYNYGQLQVVFDDGSVGWYEAGWGPMMSEESFFVKDIVGPDGSVTIEMGKGDGEVRSADVDAHTRTSRIRRHYAALDANGRQAIPDELIDMSDEPGHDELCEREQRFFLGAIREDLDLSAHMAEAVDSLRIVLAADRSIRSGEVVTLGE